jgi:predicted amidohydrolase YtcJ
METEMMKKLFFVTVLTGLWLLSTIFSAIGSNDADLILFNGKIITIDTKDNIYEAIAIKNGKIIQLGGNAEIKSLAGLNCRLIDLKGKTVTPGLIDSHYHMMYYGQQFWPGYLNIRYPDVKSKADLLKVVGDRAKQLKKGVWISGNQGFLFQMNETLDRKDLDAVSPDNPVYLRHGSGQYAVVNSKALDTAGVNRNTPNPPSSLILRDSNGDPTGVLSHYPAENLVARFATGYGDRTTEQKTEDIEKGQTLCLQAGYTSIQDVIIGSDDDITLYKNFSESGKLKVRLYTMLYLNTEEQVNNYAANYKPVNSGLFTFGGWKLAMDGGFAAKTILMYDTSLYISEISYPYFNQETLNRIIATLHNTGRQVAVHVSGDRGIDMTLKAFEEAMKKNPRKDPRHRIEHGLFPTDSALQRMKTLKIILSTQPQWINWYGDGYKAGSNTETMNRLLPLKKMIGMGIPVAFGCDVPASLFQEPRYAFIGSVLRRTSSGVNLNTDQCLTMQEALRIHTMGSAYASFSDSLTGSLEPGKFADLVVWSHDLYATLTPAEILSIKSEMTIVNGEVQFNSGLLQITTNLENIGQSHGFTLLQNYPNPFSIQTRIDYQLPEESDVLLKVYNLMGQEIKILVSSKQTPGNYSVEFNSEYLPVGQYIYRLSTSGFTDEKLMNVVR